VIDPAECRQRAAECLQAAQIASTSELKATLLTMSRLWTALAVQAQRLRTLVDEEAARKAKERDN
jgi:hypothetical protein